MKQLNLSAMVARMTNKMFRRIDGLKWDLATGQVGIQSKEGLRTLTRDTDAAGVTHFGVAENPLELFEMAIPAFALGTPLEQVQEGDMVVFKDNNTFGWVTRKLAKSLDVLKGDGTSTNYTPNKVVNSLLGGDGGTVLVVRSLATMLGGGAADGANPLASMQTTLLPLMMLGGDDSAFDDILPLMLFSGMNQGTAGAAQANSLLPMLLMSKMGGKGDGGGLEDMLPLLMLSGGGGLFGAPAAGGAANPMANLMPLMLMSKLGGGKGFFG